MDLKNSIFNFLEQEGNSNDFEKKFNGQNFIVPTY